MEVDEIARQEKALELYEKGSSKESIGLMRDAIVHYAAAIKTHQDVEKLYRAKLQLEHQQSLKDRELSQSLQSLQINDVDVGSEEDQESTVLEPCWLLDILTDDILLEIISILILKAPHSHVNLSTSCSKLSELCFGSSAYRSISKLVYPHQVYSESALRLNNITKNQEEMVKAWDFNWEAMLNDRPFIKFQGVYISKVTYISDGANYSSFYTPVKLVTYFRYLRFYPDGSVYKLTTTDEPSLIVPTFDKETYYKYAIISRFTLEMDGQVILERDTESYKFIEELKIVNLGDRKFHRLNWVSSSTINEDGDRSYFSLRKEKPFNFSGVRSYKVNYGEKL